jgi:hypothetical protein
VRFTRDEVDQRRVAVRRLASDGLNDYEIARRLCVSKPTITNDRLVLGVDRHLPGRPPKSPLPERRPCEICGERFQPKRKDVLAGAGRFCGKPDCIAQDPVRREASRRKVTELNAERAKQLERVKVDRDLLSRDEAAAELGVKPSSIDHYFRQGYLTPVHITDIPGQPATLVARADVEQFRRDWRAVDARGMRASWLDPEHVVRRNRARGITTRDAGRHNLPIADMEDLYRVRVERRRKLFTRRGRPKGGGPPDHHYEWVATFDHWREELSRQHEERKSLRLLAEDDRLPTDQDVYLTVAELDFAAHPERWDGYTHAPGDSAALHPKWAKTAASRIRSAVNRLQIAEKETL